MKKILIALSLSTFLLVSCGSSKNATDYDQVDEDFEKFKDRNPDSD